MAATEKSLFLRKRAAAAAYTLLGIVPAANAKSKLDAAPAPIAKEDRWLMDVSFMRYSEAERITVIEPQVKARREFADNRSLDILVSVDTISGATPLGTLPATANTAPNTITNASGRLVSPVIGKVPLSDMKDTRYAIDTTWQQPMGSDYTGVIGANVSKETDFLAIGGSTKVSRDFNQKNTTVSLGVGPEVSISKPNGGLPVAFATVGNSGAIDGTRDSKWLLSGLAGVTQVINRRMLMQFNYGLTYEHGYLNDPYKLLSVVNAQGDPLSSVYEKRPAKRIENSIYWLTRYNIWGKDVFSLGLRYYTDDWGINSQTLDFSFRRQSSDRFYWEPRVRYYYQSAANFYRIGLLNTQATPEFASADLRLAEIFGTSFGLGFGYTLENGSILMLRGEYYTQSGDSHPSTAVGAQRYFDLYPSLNAFIVQVDYQFEPSKLWSK